MKCTHTREDGSTCWEYTRDKRNKTDDNGVEWAWFLCSRCDASLFSPVKPFGVASEDLQAPRN